LDKNRVHPANQYASFQKLFHPWFAEDGPQRVVFDSKAPASHSENPVGPSFSDKSILGLVTGTHLPDDPKILSG
jgi:hypothetical protein